MSHEQISFCASLYVVMKICHSKLCMINMQHYATFSQEPVQFIENGEGDKHCFLKIFPETKPMKMRFSSVAAKDGITWPASGCLCNTKWRDKMWGRLHQVVQWYPVLCSTVSKCFQQFSIVFACAECVKFVQWGPGHLCGSLMFIVRGALFRKFMEIHETHVTLLNHVESLELSGIAGPCWPMLAHAGPQAKAMPRKPFGVRPGTKPCYGRCMAPHSKSLQWSNGQPSSFCTIKYHGQHFIMDAWPQLDTSWALAAHLLWTGVMDACFFAGPSLIDSRPRKFATTGVMLHAQLLLLLAQEELRVLCRCPSRGQKL